LTQELLNSIQENINGLTGSERFRQWISTQTVNPGDFIVINNSTLLRDLIKTNKSQKYIALQIKQNKPFDFIPQIVSYPENLRKISDFDIISGNNKEFQNYKKESLPIAIEEEMDNFGKLVFLLIGHLDQSQIFEVQINHSQYKRLICNHNISKEIELHDDEILIKDVFDVDYILDFYKRGYLNKGENEQDILRKLKEPLDSAVKSLKEDAHILLVYPKDEQNFSDSFLDRFIHFYKIQLQNYEDALKKLDKNILDATALNEILRISYTFREEMHRMLRLIFSICDLKPIIFWDTIESQFALSDAFDVLPFYKAKENEKLSLENYKSMIHGARNHAFHDVLDFNQDVEAVLDDVSLKAHKLRLFSEHASKKRKNLFDYEDREIVEILTEFTRSGEKYVPMVFWHKNFLVLDAFTNLVSASASSLKRIFVSSKTTSTY